MSKSGILKDIESAKLYVDCEAAAEVIDARTHGNLLKILEDLETDIKGSKMSNYTVTCRRCNKRFGTQVQRLFELELCWTCARRLFPELDLLEIKK